MGGVANPWSVSGGIHLNINIKTLFLLFNFGCNGSDRFRSNLKTW
jgi:hypothetical protein